MAPGQAPKRPLVAWLRTRLKRSRLYARWLWHEVPKNPRYELFARRQSLIDRRDFLAHRAGGPAAMRATLAPFRHVELPRVIWMYWHQGEAEAPAVVRRCIESWRRHNPGWEVRVLTAETVGAYADLGAVPAALSFRFSANLLRLRLLRDHGGVWADATAYCHRPLDDWAPLHVTTGFFALRDPGPARALATWFMMSEPGHILPTVWEAAYAPYLRGLRYVPDMYFVFFYIFQWQIRTNPEAAAALKRASALPAGPSFVMMEVLRGTLPAARLHEVLAAGTPVSKLTWKEIVDEAAFDALCAEIDTGPAARVSS